MVDSLYLDGCSYVYGLNIDSKFNLESKFKSEGGYNVANLARPGKSNLAIAMDVYKNAHKFDVVVVGWTHSTRFYLELDNLDIDFLPTRTNLDLPDTADSAIIDTAYHNFHKYFYSMYQPPFIDKFSDMLVETTYHWLKSLGKRVVFFAFEPRSVNIDLYIPYRSPEFTLPCGHLNVRGTEYLYHNLQRMLGEQ